MVNYLIRRLGLTLVTVLVLSYTIFAIVQIPPGDAVEREVRNRQAQGDPMSRDEILTLQTLVRRVPVADHVFEYAARLARATRPGEAGAPDFIGQYLAWGAGPRASLFMILAGKARAVLRGRYHVAVEDVRAAAHPVLRHRIIPNFAAKSEGLTSDAVISRLLEAIPADERLYDGT